MTDAGKDIVERFMELTVNATFIADEHADVLRPKQIERLYATRDLMEAQATTIEALRTENEEQARINGMGAERELALRTENASLRARVEKLEGALNYYAANHEWPNEGPWGVDSTDFGEVARAALEGGKHD